MTLFYQCSWYRITSVAPSCEYHVEDIKELARLVIYCTVLLYLSMCSPSHFTAARGEVVGPTPSQQPPARYMKLSLLRWRAHSVQYTMCRAGLFIWCNSIFLCFILIGVCMHSAPNISYKVSLHGRWNWGVFYRVWCDCTCTCSAVVYTCMRICMHVGILHYSLLPRIQKKGDWKRPPTPYVKGLTSGEALRVINCARSTPCN